MIFDGKPLDRIQDGEILDSVSRRAHERQHLEFKVTINLQNDEGKLEALLDIVSFANAGGGYLIVGVRDDGNGRALRFEPGAVGDVNRIAQSLRALAQDHIAERIEDLEIEPRTVSDNPVVIVRVPVSARRPHMVTHGNRTYFVARYEDGKREMHIGEIRAQFTEDLFGRRLSQIESAVAALAKDLGPQREAADITSMLSEGTSAAILLVENDEVVMNLLRDRFRQEAGEQPYFRIAATPHEPRRSLLNADDPIIRNLLARPPGSRRAGWNMEHISDRPTRTVTGLTLGNKGEEYLELYENGYMEFRVPLDKTFRWRQSAEEAAVRPRLYPYPVVEYPTTFLRLYKAILDAVGYHRDILVELEYRNAKGYVLHPGTPQDLSFDQQRVSPYKDPHLIVPAMRFPAGFDPDRVAYQLVRMVYAAFRLEERTIPFYSETSGFKFPS